MSPADTLAPGLPFTALDRALVRELHAALPGADPAHAWLAALASHQWQRGHACLDLPRLAKDPAALLGWPAAALAPLAQALPDPMGAARGLPWREGGASPLVLSNDGQRLYLRRAWAAEEAIRERLAARLAPWDLAPEELAAPLAALFAAQPSGGQMLACALAARSALSFITGGPGTGKTTTVVRLIALLHALRPSGAGPLRVQLAAPTGKAAARLSESVARQIDSLPAALRPPPPPAARTLHGLLNLRPETLALPPPTVAADLVVVDEASMIDLDMMARLARAVPAGARLVLLGDKDQLASVEAGAVMAQLCEGAGQGGYAPALADWLARAGVPDVARAQPGAPRHWLADHQAVLRESHRFAAAGGIGRWALAVNAGDAAELRALLRSAAPGVERLSVTEAWEPQALARMAAGWRGVREGLAQVPDGGARDAWALALLAAQARFQILCALRQGPLGTQRLNRLAARALGVPPDESWFAGRPVIVTRNDHALGLMNGDMGLVLPHADGGLKAAFATGDGRVRWVSPARLAAVETAWALTVHKAQGSEFDGVLLVLPERDSPVLTRELVYTGITRAKASLALLAPSTEVLLAACARRVVRSGALALAP